MHKKRWPLTMQHHSSPFRITRRVDKISEAISKIIVPLHGDKFHPFVVSKTTFVCNECTSKGKAFLIRIYLCSRLPAWIFKHLWILRSLAELVWPVFAFDCLPREQMIYSVCDEKCPRMLYFHTGPKFLMEIDTAMGKGCSPLGELNTASPVTLQS